SQTMCGLSDRYGSNRRQRLVARNCAKFAAARRVPEWYGHWSRGATPPVAGRHASVFYDEPDTCRGATDLVIRQLGCGYLDAHTWCPRRPLASDVGLLSLLYE